MKKLARAPSPSPPSEGGEGRGEEAATGSPLPFPAGEGSGVRVAVSTHSPIAFGVSISSRMVSLMIGWPASIMVSVAVLPLPFRRGEGRVRGMPVVSGHVVLWSRSGHLKNRLRMLSHGAGCFGPLAPFSPAANR